MMDMRASFVGGAAERQGDNLTRSPLADAIDRWIYVFTAASFIVIVLAGFIPSSLATIAAVEAGRRPPFPLLLHLHATLMGAFLLLLFAQTILAATGRRAMHKALGMSSLVLVPAIVVVGFLLASGNYQAIWSAATTGPLEDRAGARDLGLFMDNILLLQLRIGILFPVLFALGLLARRSDPGVHKRMMILAAAIAVPAGIDRIPWLPTTIPASPVSSDLYMLLAIAPMLVWDLARSRRVHRAYWIWLAVAAPFTVLVHGLWDSDWWHEFVPQLMRV
jgi:hypothetical protein